MPEPAKKAPAKKPAVKPQGDPLPTHKDDLAALAISQHGIPSYEAWAMTVPELTEKLEG